MRRYLFDAGVKGTFVAFDEAVGVDDEGRAAYERRGVRERSRFSDGKVLVEPDDWAVRGVEESHLTVGVQDDGRGVSGGRKCERLCGGVENHKSRSREERRSSLAHHL